MKDQGLTEIPQIWQTYPLGDIAEIIYGKPLRKQDRKKGNIPVFGSSGIIDYHDTAMHPGNSIVIGRKGSVGTVNYVSKPFWSIDTTFIVNNINKSVDVKFLAYALKSINLPRLSITVGVPGINRNTLESQKILIPPLQEQHHIVRIFQAVEDIQNLRLSAKEITKTIQRSLFFTYIGDPDPHLNNMGWKIVNLGSIVETGTGGTPSRSQKNYYNGSHYWVKTTELNDNIIYETEETLSDLGISKSNATLYPVNTILVAMYGQGQTRGRTAKLGISAAVNQACAAFLPSSELLPDYLWYWFQNSYERIRRLSRGGPQENLNLQILRNLKIPKPPIEIQLKFITLIKQLESISIFSNSSSLLIESLHENINYKIFIGDLTKKWRESQDTELQKVILEKDMNINFVKNDSSQYNLTIQKVNENFARSIQLLASDALKSIINFGDLSIDDFYNNLQNQVAYTDFAELVQNNLSDLSHSFQKIMANSVTNFDESTRNSLKNIQYSLRDFTSPLADSLNISMQNYFLTLANQMSKIALNLIPQPNRAIHESLDEDSKNILIAAKLAPVYFRPEDLSDDDMRSVEIESRLHLLEALGFVRKVILDGQSVYRLIQPEIESVDKSGALSE